MEPAKTIKLLSSDGKVFEIDEEVAKCSTTLRMLLEFSELDENEEDNEIELPNVRAKVLEKVLLWADYHKNDESRDVEDMALLPRTRVGLWDSLFIYDVKKNMLVDLILAANYLDIKGLLQLSCMSLARIVNRSTYNEIREYFEAPPDDRRDGDDSYDVVNQVSRVASGYGTDDGAI